MSYSEVAQIILTIIGIAATIAALTPTKRDDSVIGRVSKFIDIFALNVLNAKNKDD